jgi:hypothetical protein
MSCIRGLSWAFRQPRNAGHETLNALARSNSSIKPTAGPYSAAAEQYLHVGTAAANRSRRKHSLVAAAAAPTRSRRGWARGGLAIGR